MHLGGKDRVLPSENLKLLYRFDFSLVCILLGPLKMLGARIKMILAVVIHSQSQELVQS